MSVALRIARRELAGGLRGFWVYALCLAVGAFAIAAAGSVTEGFDRGLQDQSRTLLGGDVEFVAAQRRASADERAVMDGLGRVSEVVNLDVMGARGDTRKQVDIRAVDGAFPLIGALSLSPAGAAAGPTLAKRDGVWGAAVSRSLLETFDADLGDAVDLGPVTVEIRAVLEATPDRVGAPGAFGPAALVALDAFIEAGRLTNGQLFRASYRVLLNEGAGGPPDAAIDAAIDAAAAAWGPAGLRARQPEDAVDGLRDALSMLNAFLAVVGVAALIAGGVGVAQATSAFLETRLEAIAALKALGADAAIIRAAYALQLSALAGVGAVGGVTLGALAPLALEAVAGTRIPLDQKLGFYPGPVFLALLLAMLSAGFFAAPALGRARATKPAALFRGGLHENAAPTPRFERGAALAAGCALCAAAIATSARPPVTAGLLLGAALAYGVLRLAALGVKRAARAGARRRSGIVRIALSNLAGPQSLAPLIAPALGLGLALSTLIAGVQENLIRQLNETAPSNAPSLVFTQIPNQETAAFDAALAREGVDVSDVDAFRRAPIALARVVALNGAPIERDKIAESERWVVESEVALTYLADPPPEADITDGTWWPSDYRGPLRASIEADAARGLGLAIGDTVGLRVFGRDLTAEVASFRNVDWGGFGANLTFIVSPGTLEAANPQHFAIAKATPDQETAIVAALADAFPDVVVFQTREALAAAAALLSDVGLAVNAAAGVVIVSGALVLIGAFAAMARRRRSEAALLKVFGAERARVMTLYAVEFAVAGAAAAFFGAAMGLAAAYPVVVGVFEASWTTPWRAVLSVSGVAIAAAAVGGGVVGAAALSTRPARSLRS